MICGIYSFKKKKEREREGGERERRGRRGCDKKRERDYKRTTINDILLIN
jgi:hypothetical protein